MMKSLLRMAAATGAIALAWAGFGPGAANATIILNLDCDLAPCTENTDSSALLTFNFAASGNDIILTLGVENTSTELATLTAIAFLAPDIQSASVTNLLTPDGSGTGFTALDLDATISGIGGVFDICVNTDNNCVGGSASGGLLQGHEMTITIRLDLIDTSTLLGNAAAYESAFASLILAASPAGTGACARFQQVGADQEDSDKVCSVLRTTQTPEPGTLALLGFGLIGLGWYGRRRAA